MVRILKQETYQDGKRYIEAAGLSTDTKPTDGVITGSVFVAVDTGKGYLFKEADTSEWVEQ